MMEKILQSKPHFIRCIKANNNEQANTFDDEIMRRQIQGFCVYDTLRVRQHGFPVRLTFKQFIERYQFISYPLSTSVSNTKESVTKVLCQCNISGYEIGSAKVFLKHKHEKQLNSHLSKVEKDVVIVQKMFRGRLARIDYEFLMNNRKHEERTIGNFLMSISTKPAKLHDALVSMSKQDVKRRDKETEENRRKLRENLKKKASGTKTDNSRRHRSKDDSHLSSRYIGSSRPIDAHSQTYKGELPLMRDFTRGRRKAWCRIDCYERQFHMASFFLHQPVITIDGSHVVDQSAKIGLCYLPSKADDSKVSKVKNCIGKGLKLHQDDAGNVWATRLGKNPIFVRGFFLSPELIKLSGKLTQGVPMKVFDLAEHKDNLANELSKTISNEQETRTALIGTCKVCISFIKDTIVDDETPCWVEVWFVEHVENVRKKLLAVIRQQKQSKTAAKSSQTSATVKEISTEGDAMKSNGILSETPTKDPRPTRTSLEPKTKEPARHGSEKLRHSQVNKTVEDTATGIAERPPPENGMRIPLRSPHIAVSGGKARMGYETYQEAGALEVVSATAVEVQEVETSPYYELSNLNVPNYDPNLRYNYELPETNGQGQSGLSYGKVFGMSAYDYAFDFAPPAYRRHRRHSDSDSESVRNFMSSNMPIHGILELEEKKPTPLQPMKWISKKTRKKSEDQRRKAFPVR